MNSLFTFHGHFWSFYSSKCSWNISVPTCLGQKERIFMAQVMIILCLKINHRDLEHWEEQLPGKHETQALCGWFMGPRTLQY